MRPRDESALQAGGQQPDPGGSSHQWGGPLVGMHGPSLSSPADRPECLRTRHERLICFTVQTAAKEGTFVDEETIGKLSC